ncbi:hypothetical protein B0A50_06717 [Salinomyces thailandicus]|uniref:protein-tyrosine-phosphatase n=1 Tax=Salinomyces thailandicus TaxID=706561 RepID=A0A4U0TQT7_9PEZI|nr:hypothetical protein B0A50_06717 [Salinomyces thailandica]
MSSQFEEQTTETTQLSLSSAQRSHHPPSYADKLFYRYHQHSISDSTAASGSNDSSPTTTASTVDDSSATEPSPGSSPESPPPSTFSAGMLRPQTSADSSSPFFELAKPPPKKGRNLKGLAVNTARHPRAASTTSLPLQKTQAPTVADDANPLVSPAFLKPPSPPKRKPSGLTLLTPGASKSPPQEVRLAVPPTPAFGRPATLRHFQSSPSLPLFPGLNSQTGMSTQGPRRGPPAPLDTIVSPIEPPKQVVKIEEEVEEEEQNFDVPLSKEEKPEAYPEGPICVYEPGVDLYLEPTAEQCRDYDVVMNVASEVRNPLLGQDDASATEPEIRIDGGGGIQYQPKHLQVNNPSDTPARDCSPTTPKATPLNSEFPAEVNFEQERDPEYIHIPWEHNSDIVPDLLGLVKLIDERTKQGKRVLVHCQCGVSRSASLVVAYGLYKDPIMSVQEAYDAVKKRSRWIGPNMNLIMQLQEFRTSLTRGGLLPGNRGFTPITPGSAFGEWRGPFSTNPSDPTVRNAPMSASMITKSQTATKDDVPAISPGPSSAPSSLQWPIPDQLPPSKPPQRPRAISAIRPASAYVDPAGHLVPVLKVVEPDAGDRVCTVQVPPELSHDDQDCATPTDALASPRSAEFAMTPLQPPKEVDPADDFGIMSPTSTEFASSPFDRSTLLASLGMGSVQPDNAPRRSLSLRSRSKPTVNANTPQQNPGLTPCQTSRLRGKLSQPSLREQQELQSLQAKIEAHLPRRPAQHAPGLVGRGMDDALMSPRATEFTQNPFALSVTEPVDDNQPEKEGGEAATRSPEADPRSPAHVGGSPITRSILDVL